MAMVALDLTPNLQRMALTEIMETNRWSIDYLADLIGVPTIPLRRWMHDSDPETNRQRYEWHVTQHAVTVFLSTYDDV